MTYSLRQGDGWSVMHDHGDVRVAASKDLLPLEAQSLARAILFCAQEAKSYRDTAVAMIRGDCPTCSQLVEPELEPTTKPRDGLPRFAQTYCSQCGGEFGPGNSGFSDCSEHQHLSTFTDSQEIATLGPGSERRPRVPGDNVAPEAVTSR